MRLEAWLEGDSRVNAREFEGYAARDSAEMFWRYRCAANPACYNQEVTVCVGSVGSEGYERYRVSVRCDPVFVVRRLP